MKRTVSVLVPFLVLLCGCRDPTPAPDPVPAPAPTPVSGACACVYPFTGECEQSCDLRDVIVKSVNGNTATVETIPKAGERPVIQNVTITDPKFNAASLKPGSEIQISSQKKAPLIARTILVKKP